MNSSFPHPKLQTTCVPSRRFPRFIIVPLQPRSPVPTPGSLDFVSTEQPGEVWWANRTPRHYKQIVVVEIFLSRVKDCIWHFSVWVVPSKQLRCFMCHVKVTCTLQRTYSQVVNASAAGGAGFHQTGWGSSAVSRLD